MFLILYQWSLYSLFMLETLLRGYIGLLWPFSETTWIVGGVHWNAWILNSSVVHHPAPWAYVCGIFIFRRCMVWHLQFFLSLASQPLSRMEHLRFRRVYCASAYLGIPGVNSWNILGVTWYPYHHIHQLWIFRWSTHSVFYGRSRARFLVVYLSFFGTLY